MEIQQIDFTEGLEHLQEASDAENWCARFTTSKDVTRAFSVGEYEHGVTVIFDLVCADADAEWKLADPQFVEVIAESNGEDEITNWYIINPYCDDGPVATIVQRWGA